MSSQPNASRKMIIPPCSRWIAKSSEFWGNWLGLPNPSQAGGDNLNPGTPLPESKTHLEHSLILLLILAAIVAGGIYLANLNTAAGQWYDDGWYLVLAKALASGAGYRQINVPGAPPEGHFPPGYPLLLAPVWWLPLNFPARIIAFKLTSVIATLIWGVLVYRYLTRNGYATPHLALFIVALTWFNPLVLYYATLVASEMSYALVVVIALLRVESYARTARERADSPFNRHLVWAALAIAAACYLRSVGLAVAGSAVAYLLVNRHWKHSALLAVTVAALYLPWLLHVRSLTAVGETSSYLSILRRSFTRSGQFDPTLLSERLVKNVHLYLLGGLPGIVFPSTTQLTWINLPATLRMHPYSHVASTLITIITLTGLLVTLVARRSLLPLYVIASVGICILWPWEPTRYLVSLTPFIAAFFFKPLVDLARALGPRMQKWSQKGALVILLAYLFLEIATGTRHVLYLHSDAYAASPDAQLWADIQACYTWLNEHTASDDVLAMVNTPQGYLYTGHPTVKAIQQPEKLHVFGVRYAVLLPFPTLDTGRDMSAAYFDPLLARHPQAFSLVYESRAGMIRVYEVNLDKLPAEESNGGGARIVRRESR